MKRLVMAMVVASLLLPAAAFSADPDGAAGPWADQVISFDQGTRKNDTSVLLERSDPTAALGVAEGTVGSGSPLNFVSLGFGGTIILGFDNFIDNGADPDSAVLEITNGSYPLEKVAVSFSQDGSTFIPAGFASNNGTGIPPSELTTVSLPASMAWARFVKLEDISDETPFEPTADGFDLDGVKALHSRAGADCVLTLGWWRKNPDQWPATTTSGDTVLWLGDSNYDEDCLLGILNAQPRGNGLIALAKQLIVAKLNIANGAPVPPEVVEDIIAADEMIKDPTSGSGVPPCNNNDGFIDDDDPDLMALVEALDNYNTGYNYTLGTPGYPPHCE